MAISPEEFERLPPFLQNFLIERGANPGLTSNSVSTPSVAPLLPPLPRRSGVVDDGGGLFEGSPASTSFLSPEASSAMWSRGWDSLMGQGGLSGQISSIGNDISSIPGQISQGISDIGTEISNAPSNFMTAVAGFFNSVEPTEVADLNDYRRGYDYEVPTGLTQVWDNPLSISSLGNTKAGISRLSDLRDVTPFHENSRKLAAHTLPVAAAFMGPQAGLLGVFGGLFNKMGAYHNYDPNADTNITIDPETGLVGWDSTNMGGGGMYQGMLNAENFAEDLAARDPNMSVHVGKNDQGMPTYSNIQDLSDYMAFARQANNPNSEFFMMDAYNDPTYAATTDTPWAYGKSNYANLSNNEAINSLSNRTGNAWNHIGSITKSDQEANELAEQALASLQAAAWHAANFGTGGNSGLGADYDAGVSSYTGVAGNTSGSGEGSDTGIGGDDDWDF